MLRNILEEFTKFHATSYVIEIYKDGKEKEIVYGNREIIPKVQKVRKNTLYDIASLTKVYTAVLVYMAYEEGKINLYETVFNIDNRFKNLRDIKIIDLLSHNQEIWTDGYLGKAESKEEFYKILFSAKVKSKFLTYLDVHYIILATILEKVYKKTYDILLKEKIIDVLNLKDTTINPKRINIASCNYELLDGKVVDYIPLGFVHDTKARVAKNLGITTGHASIFTTGKEMLIFLKTFLDGTLLKKETISLMLSHKDINKNNYKILSSLVKEENINNMYLKALEIDGNLKINRTYNNMGVRYHNDIESLNDVPNVCSDNTVVFSGFTGPSFIIDFDKKIIVIVMCNVLHNTKLNRIERKKYTDTIIEDICKNIY